MPFSMNVFALKFRADNNKSTVQKFEFITSNACFLSFLGIRITLSKLILCLRYSNYKDNIMQDELYDIRDIIMNFNLYQYDIFF